MSSFFIMMDIIFLVETVAEANAEVIGSSVMCHQVDMGMKVIVNTIAGGDFLVEGAFAEVGESVVSQVHAKLKEIRQPVHGHRIAEAQVEFGHLKGSNVNGIHFLLFCVVSYDKEAVVVDDVVR